MATGLKNPTEKAPYLLWKDGDTWITKDEETGIASQGKSRQEREFIQQIGRTVRSPEDVVEFSSPDAKCHKKLRQSWEGEISKRKTSQD
ncbi:hypothetical protein AKJ65_07720 [candidate division MSBL1 archaeon SCGC-AAA259E19]|uniref:Uncharacterized protein n=1 Tax=candidate division MSBL1 archaeon SCGC-AAA259E19 TaxID=1698264 RepID=A0A133UDP3_9EURY|nr:hypothetical protein AKJ65_07720 [candidate division MSBL1 archaeon SCGC-AAA259E19]